MSARCIIVVGNVNCFPIIDINHFNGTKFVGNNQKITYNMLANFEKVRSSWLLWYLLNIRKKLKLESLEDLKEHGGT